MADDAPSNAPASKRARTPFRAVAAAKATALTDCASLRGGVLMPWVGFGTYRLGQSSARTATLAALRCGYRMIDTAYIYAGEKCEPEVGHAIAKALDEGTLASRDEVFVVTKHWRKFHGYAPALGCLERSLARLQLSHVDLWLMHWPGPAWTTMNRKSVELEAHGPWHYAASGHGEGEIRALRAETWRAMEDALAAGKTRAIGVSNFTVAHLEALKATAQVWPPAVNQVEAHPHYPNDELRAYCDKEGIVLQAYAALGGQDGSKAKWQALGGHVLSSAPVLAAAAAHAEAGATPAKVLLRWALQRGCSITPKSANVDRMAENADVFGFALSDEEVSAIASLCEGAAADPAMGRLCWRTDPLRMLTFE